MTHFKVVLAVVTQGIFCTLNKYDGTYCVLILIMITTVPAVCRFVK